MGLNGLRVGEAVAFESHPLTAMWQCKLQIFCMKIQSVGRLTVERVAYDGCVEAVGVGTVYA